MKGLIEDIALAIVFHYAIKLVRWTMTEVEVRHAMHTLDEVGSWTP